MPAAHAVPINNAGGRPSIVSGRCMPVKTTLSAFMSGRGQLEQATEHRRAGHDKKAAQDDIAKALPAKRSEEHTSELQALMRNSYAVFCLKKQDNRMTFY